MLIRHARKISENEVTPLELFQNRRRFLAAAAAVLGGGWTGREAYSASCDINHGLPESKAEEVLTPLRDFARYNNYYEFSTSKEAVRILAQDLTITPWKITIEGEVEKPYTLDVDELKRKFGNEERIYRFRCVEGWSMVVPWSGFSLCSLIELARPTSRAKFVEFASLQRPSEMIGQRGFSGALEWPYREGLRIDEAVHPLTLVALGAYGQALPKQNGAPIRIVVPWKYGFKSPKAVTHIRLLAKEPFSSWHHAAASEYGFYGNVNPQVAHPRWSQARESRIGELHKRPTLYLNGYADQVGHLYAGLDPNSLY